MAARFRKIYSIIWDDEDFLSLPGEDQRVALYCLTCRQVNRIGLFVFSKALASETLKIPFKDFGKRFGNVCQTLKWPYDERSKVLYIPSWWKWNQPENKNVLIGNLSDLDEVPKTELKSLFCNNLQYLKPNVCQTFAEIVGDVTGNVTETLPKRLAIQEQEQEQENEQEQEQEQDFSSEPQAASEPEQSREENQDVRPEEPKPDPEVLRFPVVGGDEPDWALLQSKVDEFHGAFPAVDILAECRKALEWCRCNQPKRKTARGMPSFLFKWLEKAQNRGGASPPLSEINSGTGNPYADGIARAMKAREANRGVS